jgi:hypothetical protein
MMRRVSATSAKPSSSPGGKSRTGVEVEMLMRLFFVLFLSCSTFALAGGIEEKQNAARCEKPITKDAAVKTAKEEMARRGHHGTLVYKPELDKKHWNVHVEKHPTMVGLHWSVIVDRCGNVIDFIGGR